MQSDVCQRWDRKRSIMIPLDPCDTSSIEVAPIPDKQCREFVTLHHYSHAYPAARRRFGVYQHGELVGCAVYGQPCNAVTLKRLPDPESSIELSRLVLLDRVKANAESFVIARCHDALRREGFTGVITFADPYPRHTAQGETVFLGHVGTIYQASNAVYVGAATARRLHLLPNGTVYSQQSIGKIQRQIQGWQYAVRILVAHGATPLSGSATRLERDEWLKYWLGNICHTVRHPGNLTYLIGLTTQTKRLIRKQHGNGLPYVKMSQINYRDNCTTSPLAPPRHS